MALRIPASGAPVEYAPAPHGGQGAMGRAGKR